MKNSQKGFVVPILLALVALLVVGGGVYVYKNKKVETSVVVDTETQETQTSDNTQASDSGKGGSQINIPAGDVVVNSKLSLYKNESCGFEISFPSNFVSWDQPNNKNPKDCPNPIPSYDPMKEYLQVNSLSLKSGADCSIGQSGESKSGCNYFSVEVTNSQIKGPKVENILVDNMPAEKFPLEGSGSEQILIQFKKNNLWYRYTHTFSPEGVKEAERLTDSIISTFKFTK